MTRKRKSDMDSAALLLKSVTKWFDAHPEDYKRMLTITNKTNGGSVGGGGNCEGASLRMLDWFVTNYARRANTAYIIEDEKTGEKRLFIVFIAYKVALDYYHKDLFDPFRRSGSEDGDDDTMEYMSRLRQLNFFQWAFANKVIDYVVLHAKEIEEDMMNLRTKNYVDDEDDICEDDQQHEQQQEQLKDTKSEKAETEAVVHEVVADTADKRNGNKKRKRRSQSARASKEDEDDEKQKHQEQDDDDGNKKNQKKKKLDTSQIISLSQLSEHTAQDNAVDISPCTSSSPLQEHHSHTSDESPLQIFNGGAVPFALMYNGTDVNATPATESCLRKRPWYSRYDEETKVDDDGGDNTEKERMCEKREMRPSSQRFRRTHFAPIILDDSANVMFSLSTTSPSSAATVVTS